MSFGCLRRCKLFRSTLYEYVRNELIEDGLEQIGHHAGAPAIEIKDIIGIELQHLWSKNNKHPGQGRRTRSNRFNLEKKWGSV